MIRSLAMRWVYVRTHIEMDAERVWTCCPDSGLNSCWDLRFSNTISFEINAHGNQAFR